MLLKKTCKNFRIEPLVVFGATTVLGMSFATASYAQSSVTLYGIVDVGVEHINNTTAGGGQTRQVSGNLSGSRWGMKGIENLGGGLSAIFVLEDGFNVNDGTTAQSTKGIGANATTTSRLFGRQSFVGLAGKGQQLTFGRQNSLLYDQAVPFDPMGASSRYSTLSLDYAMAGRIDNSAKYVGTFGPLTAAAMYSTRYDTGYGAEVPGAQITGRFYSGSLTYGTGPLAASVSFEQRNSNTVATNTSSERRVTAAATYVIGNVKAFAGYRFLRASRAFLPVNPVVTANGADAGYANMYWTGAQYRVTPALQLTAAAYYQDVHASSADPWMGVLNADYSLSKRTDLYATAAFARNKSGSALGVNGYGTVAAGYNQTGFTVGMRQKF
ncbi:putative porin [Paraburkholderia sp. BL23I1N1]|uniref:porin n=1 Tax=Paraburkholderia sp. BL23I1N1 TaxID=1938802 RepID=UPI000E72E715|nr:porin [Paraburkholderia sp. BL23I1N1]RKE34705.1 putative porin [Paraburkholderia sp. BL23I1N1]